MNSDTGKIYTDPDEIRAALRRGEPLEPIGPRVAETDKAGKSLPRPGNHDNRVTRRKANRSPFSFSKQPHALTDYDLQQIALAEAKRQRKLERNRKQAQR
jgi:hypothetical protein